MCVFVEPWIGKCTKPNGKDVFVCEEHVKEKCQVCGEQATMRCQASEGLMCGIPLCRLCGNGEMCLYHATSGPLLAIKVLLGAGPKPSIFSDKASLREDAERMKLLAERLRKMKIRPTMKDFDAQIGSTDA